MNVKTELITEGTNVPAAVAPGKPKASPYLQNRELSWLTFNERVLEQGSDETVPLLERLNFISIFWSNLQEFFMVRVGSLTDLELVKKHIIDSKSNMTPSEQLSAIYERCRKLYPAQERIYKEVRALLQERGVSHVHPNDLNDEQRAYLATYIQSNITPFLSPQIINARHPFPHLENGALYVVVRLNEQEESVAAKKKEAKEVKGEKVEKVAVKDTKKAKNQGAEGVNLGLVPLPSQCERVIKLPGEGLSFILLEHAIEMISPEIFSMYKVKHTNVICVTRNADLDATEGTDENDDDYREHMKRILKKRSRLAPVRLESERPLSTTLEALLLERLSLKPHQMFSTSVPLDLSYTFGLASKLSDKERAALTHAPFSPQWPSSLDRGRPIIDQVSEKEVLLSYPYESMDAFVQLLREAAFDPSVISIKITLYRLASQSHLAEALIAAAENGKEVTALFELRARFDESNNIEWSQRFEQAGCKVIYGFRECKVHSKICCITRQTERGLQHITQLGTGNYNEKTAKLYTDLSFITTDETFGRDAVEFFRNMALENISDNYDILWVAPLQIKPLIMANIDLQIEKAQAGEPCGLLFKTNSITDIDIIEKIVEASRANVPVTLLVRGISCIVPGVEGFTSNVRVESIVGRLLEHSRIYSFGANGDTHLYLSSADLMTRNMDKRIEIAWPVLNDGLRKRILSYLETSMSDTAKMRELMNNGSYTALGNFAEKDAEGNLVLFDSQEFFIKKALDDRLQAAASEAARSANEPAAGSAPVAVDGGPAAADTIARVAQAAARKAEEQLTGAPADERKVASVAAAAVEEVTATAEAPQQGAAGQGAAAASVAAPEVAVQEVVVASVAAAGAAVPVVPTTRVSAPSAAAPSVPEKGVPAASVPGQGALEKGAPEQGPVAAAALEPVSKPRKPSLLVRILSKLFR